MAQIEFPSSNLPCRNGRTGDAIEPVAILQQAPRDAGFTLLEILVVVAILGLLIGLVAPAALRQLGGARTSIAKQSIERLSIILDLYKLDVGSYPTTEQGLQALIRPPANLLGWNGPYLKGDEAPKDTWGLSLIHI